MTLMRLITTGATWAGMLSVSRNTPSTLIRTIKPDSYGST